MYNPREAQTDFLYLRYVILIAFVVIGTTVAALNSRQGLAFAILWLDGEKTAGRIIEVQEGVPGGMSTVSYSYRRIDGTTQDAKRRFSSRVVLRLYYDDPVEVRYSRLFSSVSTITQLWSHMRFEFTFMVSGLVVVIIAGGLTFFAGLSIVKHKLQDRRY